MDKTPDPIGEALETFSRDMLFLIHTARSFPDGHPSAARVTKMAATWWPPGDKRRVLTLGFTRNEVVLDSRFYGAKRSRVSELAAFFHSRSVKSLTLSRGFTEEELWGLARLFADRRAGNGEDLAQALASRGSGGIAVAALDIGRIHRAFSVRRDSGTTEEKARQQQTWLWLQAQNSQPGEVARALADRDLWNHAFSDHDEVLKLGYLLAGLGQRLEQGLDRLGEKDKAEVLSRLSSLGRKVTIEELSGIISSVPEAISLQQSGMVAMLDDVGEEKLIDLMAGVVAGGVNSANRIRELLKSIGGENGAAKALRMARSRLASDDRRGFAVEVWQNLEEFLLNENYQSVMKDDYYSSLTSFQHAPVGRVDAGLDLTQATAGELDFIYLSLALSGGGILMDGWERLFGHIRELAEEDPARALRLVEATTSVAPQALTGAPDLPLALVRAAILNARKLDADERKAVRRFASPFGSRLLDFLLSALKEVDRLSSRKLLVEVLSDLSRETTPVIVSRARSGPWFITRNLLIALGRRGDPLSLPYVVTALDHEEERVRREALRALARFGESGRAELARFLDSRGRQERDLRLAKALYSRGAP